MARRLLPVLILGALAAGCLAPQAPAIDPAAIGPAESVAAPAFRLDAAGCREGGGHSIHPRFDDYLPQPWMPADVQEDVGDVPLTSEWWSHPFGARPEPNSTMGNWHVTMTCDSWTLDGAPTEMVFGYVGMRIEAPPFDDAARPAVRHYLVTVVATSDHTLHEELHALGVHATHTAGVAETSGPAGTWRTLLDTEDHGVYESIWRPKAAGDMPGGVVRLWFQKENEDGTFSPIALDLVTTKAGARIQADGYGWFSHFRTADHAPLGPLPVVGPLPPGTAGETPALAYEGFDRTIVPGIAPDVRLPEAYIHL